MTTEMLYSFTKTFFCGIGLFRKAGKAEKFGSTTVYHFLVDTDLIVCESSAAFFAFGNCIVKHCFKKERRAMPTLL